MYLRQEKNQISLNGEISLTLDQIRMLEPNYPTLPVGYDIRYYEPNNIHVLNGSSPTQNLNKNWEDGNRYLRRIEDFKKLISLINQEIQEDSKEINQIKFDRLPYITKRKSEYPEIEELVIAMWENLVEKQSKELSGIKELQKRRKSTKEKYPKG